MQQTHKVIHTDYAQQCSVHTGRQSYTGWLQHHCTSSCSMADEGGVLLSGETAEAEEGVMLEGQPSGPQQPAAAFWDELLKNGYQDLQQTEMAALGKGKRERRKVSQYTWF